MGQKATLIFTDGDDGQLHISMEFKPNISDETKSAAVSCAINCLDHVTNNLSNREG